MIRAGDFLSWFTSGGVDTFVGVPDSLLKNLLSELDVATGIGRHIIAANEGSAVSYAIGTYLETGRPAAVYMQNSGLGNAINPLVSLAHRDVFGSPMVLIVGWRGEPGVQDEPQHVVQGQITRDLLSLVGIDSIVLEKEELAASQQVRQLLHDLEADPRPVAILIRTDTFFPQEAKQHVDSKRFPSREAALKAVIASVPQSARIVASTGMLGRELYDLRLGQGVQEPDDFLVVGGMGHASAIAHGIADSNSESSVWCLDGDGSLIMHMGVLAVIGKDGPKNLKHILFNNFAHDSVGGQPTAINSVSVQGLVESVGYRWAGSASDLSDIPALTQKLRALDGPALAEIIVERGFRKDLGRPSAASFFPGKTFQSVGSG